MSQTLISSGVPFMTHPCNSPHRKKFEEFAVGEKFGLCLPGDNLKSVFVVIPPDGNYNNAELERDPSVRIRISLDMIVEEA
jgi:hypothetical protein